MDKLYITMLKVETVLHSSCIRIRSKGKVNLIFFERLKLNLKLEDSKTQRQSAQCEC
jgi:hypothetical protein